MQRNDDNVWAAQKVEIRNWSLRSLYRGQKFNSSKTIANKLMEIHETESDAGGGGRSGGGWWWQDK